MLKTLISPYLFHVRRKTAGLQICGIRRLARTQRKSVHVFLSLVYLTYRTLTTEDCLGVPVGKWAKPEKQGQSVHKRDLAHSQYRSFLLSSHSQKALSTRRPSKSVQAQKGTRPRGSFLSSFADPYHCPVLSLTHIFPFCAISKREGREACNLFGSAD